MLKKLSLSAAILGLSYGAFNGVGVPEKVDAPPRPERKKAGRRRFFVRKNRSLSPAKALRSRELVAEMVAAAVSKRARRNAKRLRDAMRSSFWNGAHDAERFYPVVVG